jgi:thiamine pyrophosphate-dependent acetolactate synthase large subunit-like protein
MSGEEAHTDTVYVDVQSDQQPSQEHINLLLTAQAPLVVVGSNKLDESVRAEVLKLSANNNVPFILTPMARAKCTLTENERNYAVVDEKLGYAISKCDVALVVCTEVNWQLHFEVKKMSFNKDKVKFIFVNVQQEEIEHLKPAHIGLLGEVKAVLELINTSKVDEQFISKRVQWVTAIKVRHSIN